MSYKIQVRIDDIWKDLTWSDGINRHYDSIKQAETVRNKWFVGYQYKENTRIKEVK